MKEFFLQGGNIFFSIEPVRVVTIIDSCVVVCIYDTVMNSGGVCHFHETMKTGDDKEDNFYANYAIPNLLRKFKNIGSSKKNLFSKIIGGSSNETVKVALEILEKFKIPVLGKSIGDNDGMKIRFYTDSGKIEFKKTIEKDVSFAKDDKKIKVMIVDDSKSIRKIIRRLIENADGMEVLNEANDAYEAQKLIDMEKPDVITLDINMPGMDGVTFLSRYMSVTPIPTIMITSLNNTETGPVFQALANGAFDYFRKPAISDSSEFPSELPDKIREAYGSRKKIALHPNTNKIIREVVDLPEYILRNNLVLVGASTGGTEAVREILLRLPEKIPPFLIVQHIPAVFSKAFADRMNSLCKFKVIEGKDGDEISPCKVIIAPGGKHMKCQYFEGKYLVRITDEPPVNRFKPSIDYLFKDVSGLEGKKIVGILLSGMGSDGANGLLSLRKKGAYTIAQDEASSVVFGMPKVAAEIGAACTVAGLYEIPSLILSHLR